MINKSIERPIVIRISNVSKRFGRTQALSKISFDVRRGHVHGFLGPNGAGKTTTIKIIMDFLRADDGSVQIFGLDACRESVTIKHRIGFLSGDFDIYDNLNGKQYLNFIASQKGVRDMKRSYAMCKNLGVVLDRKIVNLSRGNKQKIALVAAMIGDPELLILDEPTTGLDPIVQQKFYRLLSEYTRRGNTVLMSSHILSEIQEVCDVVTFMRKGKVVNTASVNSIMSSAKREITLISSRGNAIGIPPSQFNADVIKHTKTRLVFRVDSVSRKVIGWIALQPVTDVLITEPDLSELFKELYKERGEA